MTSNPKSALILDLSIKMALIICLTVLVIGLISGADPIMAMIRGAIAFGSFLVLGWTASMLWATPEPEAVEEQADSEQVTAPSKIEDEVQLSGVNIADTNPAKQVEPADDLSGPVSQPAIAMAVQE